MGDKCGPGTVEAGGSANLAGIAAYAFLPVAITLSYSDCLRLRHLDETRRPLERAQQHEVRGPARGVTGKGVNMDLLVEAEGS